MRPREGWAFWIMMISAATMLTVCLASLCHGDGAFTAPGGMYSMQGGRAVLNPGYRGIANPPAECGPNGCGPGGCPLPGQPQWQVPQRPAAPPPAAESKPDPRVCRVKCGGGMGSGTLVDVAEGRGLVITAKHLGGQTPIVCTFPGGRTFEGEWVADKGQNDLAAVMIRDPGVEPVEVAEAGPKEGDLAFSAGYGPSGKYLVNRGFVKRLSGWQFELTGAARGGDSGGPVFDRRGQLVGVLWGTDGRTVVATSGTEVHVFLTRAGRYFLSPYRHNQDHRVGDLEDRVGGLERQPAQPYPIPQPPIPQPPPSDLGPIQAAINDLDRRQSALEARQDKVRDTAEALAAKYEKELPGISQNLAEAVGSARFAKERASEAGATATETMQRVNGALDEESPKSIFGRVKARIEERFGAEIPWLKYGGLALAAAVVFLFIRRDVRQRVETGDPLAIEKFAAVTPMAFDDRIAQKIADRLAGFYERRHPQSPPGPPGTGA